MATRKKMDPRNTHSNKFWTNEKPMGKKILNPRNTYQENFSAQDIPKKNSFRTTKFLRKTIWHSPKIHEKQFRPTKYEGLRYVKFFHLNGKCYTTLGSRKG